MRLEDFSGEKHPSSTIHGVSLELRDHPGRQKRERRAQEGQFSWGCRSPIDLGEGLGVKGHKEETKATSAWWKEKGSSLGYF